jgi:hypothetical protein
VPGGLRRLIYSRLIADSLTARYFCGVTRIPFGRRPEALEESFGQMCSSQSRM